MKRPISLACGAALLALVSGCTQRVDATSFESTTESLEEMQAGLSKEKAAQFKEALGVLVADAFAPTNDDTPEARAHFQQSVRDKTVDEIIAEAARVKEKGPRAAQPSS